MPIQEAGDPGAPRYPGVASPPATDDVPPRVIEVRLASDIRGSAVAALDDFNSVLRRRGVRRMEPSFRDPAARTGATAAAAPVHPDPALASFVRLHFDEQDDVAAITAELRGLREVRQAVVVPEAIPSHAPVDEPLAGSDDQLVVDPQTGLERQWYLFRCGVNHAWATATGRDVVIAGIDFGFRITHEDLRARIDPAGLHNSFDGSANVGQGSKISHGTAVLGFAAAASNQVGVVGCAFDATVWAVQANTGAVRRQGDPWANAIEWVRTKDSGGRRKVIIFEPQSGNFRSYEQVPSVNEAIRRAISDGIVVCVVAGNGDVDAARGDDGSDIPETGSILVGATVFGATGNARWSMSNFGTRVAVAAPGDLAHDVTCDSGADTAYRNSFGGTSAATAKVAGVAALMLQANPHLTPGDVRQILIRTGGAVSTAAGKPIGVFLDAASAVARAAAGTIPDP
jgi:subtilisin family serine protease